jgi:hypothetical protein
LIIYPRDITSLPGKRIELCMRKGVAKMEKKLYRVKVTLYVMAENESEACVAATGAKFDIFECAARKAEYISPAWEDAIPYNSDDDRTCSEIMSNEKRTIRLETQPWKLPPYVKAGIRTFDIENQSFESSQST